MDPAADLASLPRYRRGCRHAAQTTMHLARQLRCVPRAWGDQARVDVTVLLLCVGFHIICKWVLGRSCSAAVHQLRLGGQIQQIAMIRYLCLRIVREMLGTRNSEYPAVGASHFDEVW